jgi:hypothetical protein
MSDHVVQLPRDPRPLLDHRLPRGQVALALGDLCASLAVTDDATDEADAERWANVFGEKTKALLDLGVRSFADLQLLLPVVIYWNSPICVKSPPYPYCSLQEGGEDEGESKGAAISCGHGTLRSRCWRPASCRAFVFSVPVPMV